MYKFNCATCNSCYIGEACRHFQTRIDEQIRTDENSSIYKHLHQSEDCVNSFTFDCFSILDTTPKKYKLKIKEGINIDWKKSNLNNKFNHLTTTLSI